MQVFSGRFFSHAHPRIPDTGGAPIELTPAEGFMGFKELICREPINSHTETAILLTDDNKETLIDEVQVISKKGIGAW